MHQNVGIWSPIERASCPKRIESYVIPVQKKSRLVFSSDLRQFFWRDVWNRANVPVLSNVQRRFWNSSFSLANVENVSALYCWLLGPAIFRVKANRQLKASGTCCPSPHLYLVFYLAPLLCYTYRRQLNGIEKLHPQIILGQPCALGHHKTDILCCPAKIEFHRHCDSLRV